MYNNQFSQILADDAKNDLSLKKMADVAKSDGIIFQSLAEPMLEGVLNFKSSWPDTSGILVVVELAISCISIILCIVLFVKLRKLSIAYMVLQKPTQVKSMTLPSFIYSTPAPQTDALIQNIFKIVALQHNSTKEYSR